MALFLLHGITWRESAPLTEEYNDLTKYASRNFYTSPKCCLHFKKVIELMTNSDIYIHNSDYEYLTHVNKQLT